MRDRRKRSTPTKWHGSVCLYALIVCINYISWNTHRKSCTATCAHLFVCLLVSLIPLKCTIIILFCAILQHSMLSGHQSTVKTPVGLIYFSLIFFLQFESVKSILFSEFCFSTIKSISNNFTCAVMGLDIDKFLRRYIN